MTNVGTATLDVRAVPNEHTPAPHPDSDFPQWRFAQVIVTSLRNATWTYGSDRRRCRQAPL
jgi:hypothetical protein